MEMELQRRAFCGGTPPELSEGEALPILEEDLRVFRFWGRSYQLQRRRLIGGNSDGQQERPIGSASFVADGTDRRWRRVIPEERASRLLQQRGSYGVGDGESFLPPLRVSNIRKGTVSLRAGRHTCIILGN